MQKSWDIENWDRKSAYEFFKTFEDPYVGIQVNLDCTAFVQQCKMHSYSTHHALLYAVVQAGLQTPMSRCDCEGLPTVWHCTIPLILVVR